VAERLAITPSRNGAGAADAAPVMRAANIYKSFGGLKAVQDFSLDLPAGSLRGLIGPNGAGKTTVFNLLTGVYEPDRGSVTLAARDITGLRPCTIAALGMARTFQNIRLFGELSALDNVMLACHVRSRQSMLGRVLGSAFSRGEERAMASRAHEYLALFDLAECHDEQARNLCYGDQRRLEIARALATSPKVLLLDEPAAGMNPQEKIELRRLIRRVRDEFAVTILLIEHDMGVVMDICEIITVLDHGQVISVGTPDEVQKDPHVIEAYLGVAEPHLQET
jgi:branched-chain amino acid transport system ATP-binding protein